MSKDCAVLIISEFKTFAERIEPECFYCVFSYLAYQKALESEESLAPEIATNALLKLFKNYPFRKLAANSAAVNYNAPMTSNNAPNSTTPYGTIRGKTSTGVTNAAAKRALSPEKKL